jgi:hypothetical protein
MLKLIVSFLRFAVLLGPARAEDYQHVRGEHSSRRYDLHREPSVIDSTGGINQSQSMDARDPGNNQKSLDNPKMDCRSISALAKGDVAETKSCSDH